MAWHSDDLRDEVDAIFAHYMRSELYWLTLAARISAHLEIKAREDRWRYEYDRRRRLAQVKAYARKNKAKVLAYHKEHYQANKARLDAENKRRRAIIAFACALAGVPSPRVAEGQRRRAIEAFVKNMAGIDQEDKRGKWKRKSKKDLTDAR